MNARRELEMLLSQLSAKLKCATIRKVDIDDWISYSLESPEGNIILKEGYTPEELTEFMNKIDFEYDAGWGAQELYGFVWFEDGAWLERGEYDGSEWWEYKCTPEIPSWLK